MAALCRGEWERKQVRFQAHVRGYLVRKELRRLCQDYEDVVREIEGSSEHLQWRGRLIKTPHFTDGPLLTNEQGPEAIDDLDHSATAAKQESELDRILFPETTEAERDLSHSHVLTCPPINNVPPCPVREDRDEGLVESTGESTSVWSSLGPDMNSDPSFQDSHQPCLAEDVLHNTEALRLHRYTLTMGLIWLQQAINSRKKYLSLKDTIFVSSHQTSGHQPSI